MTRPSGKAPSSRPVEADEPSTEPIVARPDGYYWQAPDGHNEFGPFESYEQAYADLHAADSESLEPGESLRDAEDELGIGEGIDPETGEPPEGQSPPHFEQD